MFKGFAIDRMAGRRFFLGMPAPQESNAYTVNLALAVVSLLMALASIRR
jgi:hypothetical protein